jgi:hypothetical protein
VDEGRLAVTLGKERIWTNGLVCVCVFVCVRARMRARVTGCINEWPDLLMDDVRREDGCNEPYRSQTLRS